VKLIKFKLPNDAGIIDFSFCLLVKNAVISVKMHEALGIPKGL
jgi:hypothetical protein